MIKDCIVKLNNDAVTVVAFGDIEIQFPSIHRKANHVRVLYTDGKYSIVSDDYIEQDRTSAKKRKRTKKTTIEADNAESDESV